MSTSDQQGNKPLTRKQLREIRLTGATPVISEDQAASAAVPPAPARAETQSPSSADTAETATVPRSAADGDVGEMPLTRRQVREQERVRTASVPVFDSDEAPDEDEAQESDQAEELVSGLPDFPPTVSVDEAADAEDGDGDEVIVDVEPVSAVAASRPADEGLTELDETEPTRDADDSDSDDDPDPEISVLGIVADDDAELNSEEDPIATDERPVVNSSFGKELLDEQAEMPTFTPSFDDLITSDSGGSQHLAPNTLIFTPPPSGASLSGPVASTGELLITGSYDLPRGIGSQGHAHGTADGKESDAVLIDGELPPSSSPTPIAASSAISTAKPAGEVIRPPAPEKGNKLMLTLAIMAGGLALALAVVLIVGFTMNVF